MDLGRWAHVLRMRYRSWVHRARAEQDLEDELRDHVERQVAANVAAGMSPAEARTAALRAMGGIEFRKEQMRDTRGTRAVEDLGRDLVVALRSIRHARGFAAAVVLTLALGVGGNTAMFTLLRGTLLRPLPNRDGHRLLYVRHAAPGAGQDNLQFSVPEVEALRAVPAFAAVAEFSSSMPFTFTGPDGMPARIRVGIVSGNYFDVLGLDPVLGRRTTIADDGAAAPPIAVLSHEFWQRQFGGDTAVVGRVVRLNDVATTIVGVMPPAPHYPRPTDLFANTATSAHHLSATMVMERTHRMTEVFARLATGSSVDQARHDVAQVAAGMMRDHPAAYDAAARHQVSVLPLRDAINARAQRTVWLLMGAAAFVLLIACANVANLTLMRGVAREREMQLRRALGAGTARLRRLLIVENLVLALLGGALGVLVAFAGLRLLVAFAAQLTPRASEIRIDGTVLSFGLLTSVVAAIVLAFVPRLDAGQGLAASMAPMGRRATLGRGSKRLQRALVTTQLAVSLMLLAGAGLLVRTLSRLQAVETGVQVQRVLTMDLPLDGDLMREVMKQPANLARYEAMRDRVAALPGVASVAVGTSAPLRAAFVDFDVAAEGRTPAPNQPVPHAAFRGADERFFAVAGMSLLQGRTFTATDRRGTAPVVVLSRSLATQLFGDGDPVGRRVALTGEVLKFTPFSGDWRTVVGVVGDTRDRLDAAPAPTLYHPFAQEAIVGASLVVRTTADPASLRASIERVVREVNPRQLIERVLTLEQARDEAVAPRRLNLWFIATFAVLAVGIAMVGIAGVLAFSVSSRTAEIGIRMSLGATAGQVRRLVLGEGGALLATGLAVGIVGALGAARLLRTLLFGVSPNDPITLLAVASLLAVVGLLACLVPAMRAARVDPAAALRAD